MKKQTVYFLTVMVCLGGLLSADITTEDLVAKCIEASGGADAYRAVESMKITGKMFVQGLELPITAWVKRPHCGRMEVSFQGMQIVTAFNDAQGWSINPLQGQTEATKMPEEAFTRLKEELHIDHAFIDYAKSGHSVELLGEEDLDGAPVYKVRMTMKSGTVHYLYIDQDYFLVVKRKSKVKRGDNEVESEEILGDYKEVAGLMMAHSTETKMNGATVQQSTIETVEVNLPMDATLFEMPAAKSETPPAEKEG